MEPQVIETETLKPFPFEERQAAIRWEKVAGLMEDYFHEPDLQGIRVMASAAAAHHIFPQASPVWLMLIGPSGSGKTSQVGPILEHIQDVYTLSNLTDKTLLSGWRAGEKSGETGLLRRLGESIIFWISDFSSISSMSGDAKNAIGSQFREVYDGSISKNWGIGKTEEWKGKCTILCGATRAAEKAWSLMRDLGERFLYVRWRVGDMEQLALQASVQDDRHDMREELGRYVREWLEGSLVPSTERLTRSEVEASGLHLVASLVARYRRSVDRDRQGQITDVSDTEGPGRIMTACWLTAKAHSKLMKRTTLSKEDFEIAQRIAIDSIPPRRWFITQTIRQICYERKMESVPSADILTLARKLGHTSLSPATLDRTCNELAAADILIKEESSGLVWWKINDWTEERVRCLEDLVG